MSGLSAAPQREQQGVMRARGFRAMGVKAGIKREKHDLAVIVSDRACTAAGVFTQNAFAAAPVLVTRQHIQNGRGCAIVVNSGNANAATGPQGLADAREMAALTAEHLGLQAEDVLVASTGIIGVPLPMDKVRDGIAACVRSLNEGDGSQAAKAIRTTDSHEKMSHRDVVMGRRAFTVAGMAKGSGMIHPNMATMLGFITTDAPVRQSHLQEATRKAVARTFNMISVDGDESTNDMVLVLANGAAGGAPIAPDTPEWPLFESALTGVCRDLARMIAADGEGASRLMEVLVTGAATLDDARLAARSIARSNLVKSALHGGDPNWGRIVAAAGSSGALMDPGRVRVAVAPGEPISRPDARPSAPLDAAPVTLYDGRPVNGDSKAQAARFLQGSTVQLAIDLGVGAATAEAWGCDLTEEYVRFNSAYTT